MDGIEEEGAGVVAVAGSGLFSGFGGSGERREVGEFVGAKRSKRCDEVVTKASFEGGRERLFDVFEQRPAEAGMLNLIG